MRRPARKRPVTVASGAEESSEALDRFRAQHLALGTRTVETPDGRRTTVAVDEAESPLAWLARRKGRDGKPLRGTLQTADILAEYGCTFYCDIMNDDQPYMLDTSGGPIVSIPYSNEINDFTFITRKNFTTDQFRDALIEELDVLYEEGAKTGRIMNIGLHPHVTGRAHRIRAIREFIEHAKALPGVWWATREEIADWYLANHESHIPGQLG